MDNKIVFFHLAIAIIIGVTHPFLPGVLKLVFIPYVAYLLVRHRPSYFPALILIMGYGTIISVVGSLISMSIVLFNTKLINNSLVKKIVYFLTIMFPVYVYMTFIRFFKGVDLVTALTMNDYYLAFWFLPFGFIYSNYFNEKNANYLIIFGFIFSIFSPFLTDLHSFSSLRRLSQLFFISGFILLLYFIIFLRVKNVFIILFLFLLIGLNTGIFKFTFVFAVSIGLLALFNQQTGYFYLNKLDSLRRFIPKLIFIFPILFLSITLWLTPSFSNVYREINIDYSSNNLLQQVFAKIFVDRGLIWSGVTEGIWANTNFLPMVEEWKINYTNAFGGKHEVDFESHNLVLGLIRYNGYLFGMILIYFFLRLIVALYESIQYLKGVSIVLAVSLFGQGVSVFITGQYVLQLNSSFLFMTLLGGFIALGQDLKTNES